MSLFITFEGIEGAGKSTQIKRLYSWLTTHGHDTLMTREPGGTAIGRDIRAVVMDQNHGAMTDLCELLLYFADRAQHLNEVIRPAQQKGTIVLCDRYIDATLAYQGAARGLNPGWLKTLTDMVVDKTWPDMTFLFDLPVADGLKRVNTRGGQTDRIEQQDIAFHERVRQGYLALAKQHSARYIVLDATGDADELHVEICAEVKNRFKTL